MSKYKVLDSFNLPLSSIVDLDSNPIVWARLVASFATPIEDLQTLNERIQKSIAPDLGALSYNLMHINICGGQIITIDVLAPQVEDKVLTLRLIHHLTEACAEIA